MKRKWDVLIFKYQHSSFFPPIELKFHKIKIQHFINYTFKLILMLPTAIYYDGFSEFSYFKSPLKLNHFNNSFKGIVYI